jgi:hypothetical protein
MINYIIVGIVSVITSLIIINVIIKDKAKKKELNNITTYLIVFIIGLIVHGITEYIELDKWYYDKRCMTAIKMLST